MNKKIEELLDEGNKSKIRAHILTILTTDPYNLEINNIVEYIVKNCPEIYKKNDTQALNYNKESWNEKYYKQLLSDLSFNFSKERMELVLKLREYLFKEIKKENKPKYLNKNKMTNTQSTATLIIAVGVAIVIVGILIGKLLVGGLGIAVIVAGAYLYNIENN